MDFKLIQLQYNSICNARCEICPYHDSWFLTDEGRGRMNDDLFYKIIDDLAENHTVSGRYCPYLMNEPYADKDMIERTRYALDKLNHPSLEISSNMELLTDDLIEQTNNLYKENNYRGQFIISHHGTSKETVERIMKINYDKTLDNIIKLLDTLHPKIPVQINDMTVSYDNKKAYASKQDVRVYWNRLFKKHDISWRNKRLNAMSFHSRAGEVHMDDWDYSKRIREIDRQHPFFCPRITDNLHVLWTGEVVLCCMDYSHDDRYIYGDLREQTIEEVFESEKYKELYDMVTGRTDSPYDFICKYCPSPGG